MTILDPPHPVDACDCEPFVYMPAWWCSFLFRILSPRELAVYSYIAMLGVQEGISRPTVRQIQQDMGLLSDSVVFEALRELERLNFLRRLRKSGENRQNAYVRPACESTLVRLLELNVIDHRLRPMFHGCADPTSASVIELAQDGLSALLGEDFKHFEATPEQAKHGALIDLLRAALSARMRGTRPSCVCSSDDLL